MGIFIVKTLGAFVGRRIEDSILVQPFGNSRFAHAFGDKPGKDVLDDLSGLLVNNQGVFVLRVFSVSVWSKRPNKFPVFPLVLKGSPYIGGGLIGILLIHKAGNADL